MKIEKKEIYYYPLLDRSDPTKNDLISIIVIQNKFYNYSTNKTMNANYVYAKKTDVAEGFGIRLVFQPKMV